MTKFYAVHFMGLDFRPQNGNEEPWKIGETRTIKGDLTLCKRGYHFSPSWEAAFRGGTNCSCGRDAAIQKWGASLAEVRG